MGEMADFLLEQEAMASVFDPDYDDRVTCEYCGKEDLYWQKLDDGSWRLFNNNKLHNCKEYKRA